MKISIIAACATNGVIGKNNDLVWSLPDDMKYFSKKTKKHHVIMGRKNWQSIPLKYRPLPKRPNLILTRSRQFVPGLPGTHVFQDLPSAIEFARVNKEKEAFIIGGAEIYREALPIVDTMYITEVFASPEGDTFFPEWDKEEWIEISRKPHEADERHEYAFDFVVYDRKAKK